MIIGAHVIMGMYGFWLPNDPRGSWSTFVASWELFRFGPATTVNTSRSLAHRPHNRAQRLAAKQTLKHPALRLTGVQARGVARGFGELLDRSDLVLWACAVMPDHVHVVIARPTYTFEQAANLLKGRASRRLAAEGIHPFGGSTPARSPWARRQWTCFLDSTDDVRRAIRYVEDNPIREGFRGQRWRFVTPYVADV